MQNTIKTPKFNKINLITIGLCFFCANFAEAATKKLNIDTEKGYVTEALAADQASSSNSQSTTNQTTNTPPSPTSKKQAIKNTSNTSYKKKQTKTKSSHLSNTWIPEMGENPDSPETIKKKTQQKVEEKQLVDDLSNLNYNFYIPPRELYNNFNSVNNKHLPPVYFQSDYLKMILASIDSSDFKSLKTILSQYEFINEPYHQGDTILIYAIQNNKLNSARILIANGANVDATNSRQRTALHYAAALGDLESMKLLLTMGANIYAVDDRNMTPLDYAKVANQPQAVTLLNEYLNNN